MFIFIIILMFFAMRFQEATQTQNVVTQKLDEVTQQQKEVTKKQIRPRSLIPAGTAQYQHGAIPASATSG